MKQGILRIVSVLTIILGISISITVAAPGDIDPSFNATAFGWNNGVVGVIKKQPDGKFLVGGIFTDVDGVAGGGISRLNADLTVDTSFNPPDFGNGQGFGGRVLAIGLQSDGKIIVGGSVAGVNNVFNPGLKRLFPDGTLDTSFHSFEFGNGTHSDIEILPDDKILVSGVRLNSDGTLDNTFAGMVSGGKEIEVQADGKIVGGTASVRRYNPDGSVDPAFPIVATDGSIEDIVSLPDGKIIIAGTFSNVNGFQQGRISRINADGSLDLSFNQNQIGVGGVVLDIALRPDGKILIGGNFGTFNGTNRNDYAQLNANGTLDAAFVNDVSFESDGVYSIQFLPDNKILAGMDPFTTQLDQTALIRFNEDGSRDNTLSSKVSRDGAVGKVVQQADGKFIIGGQFRLVNGAVRNSVARLNNDGTLDTTFTSPYAGNKFVFALAVQPDGKILVGSAAGEALRRLNSDGSPDTTFLPSFGSGSAVYDIAVLTDGSIIAAGTNLGTGLTQRVAKYQTNGTIDSGFGGVQPNGSVRRVLVQPDGKLLIGGQFSQVGTTIRGRVARLLADGSLDTTFDPPGGANGDVLDVELQTDGKVVLAGAFTGLNGNSAYSRIGRLNSDGTLDGTFVHNQVINAQISALKIQSDGKMIIGGAFNTIGATQHLGLARLNGNGSLDASFAPGINNALAGVGGVSDILLQSDGRIIVGGSFTKINNISRGRIARLENTIAPASTEFDFDGDGKADVAVFRPSENKWYILQSSNSAVIQTVFAIANDVPVPADYDGDGKTDIAIFRPSNGNWWYISSQNGAQINYQWGQSGDIPRPSDFDADGKTDFVVFRPSNGVWYRFGTSAGTSIQAFGAAGDQPLVGDFDGDGRSDNAIFRPSTGEWWYASSVNGQFLAVHWGATGDVPVPADYDGDGKTDFAIFRPSDGGWYVANSGSGSFTILAFGQTGDRPIAADYDGDGKADIAVFRPSTGIWYLLQSGVGFGALQWGIASDTPTPGSFIQ